MNASETDTPPHYTRKKTAWKQKLKSRKSSKSFCKDYSLVCKGVLSGEQILRPSLKNFNTARLKLSKQSGTSQVVAAISFLTCPMVKAECQGGKMWI